MHIYIHIRLPGRTNASQNLLIIDSSNLMPAGQSFFETSPCWPQLAVVFDITSLHCIGSAVPATTHAWHGYTHAEVTGTALHAYTLAPGRDSKTNEIKRQRSWGFYSFLFFFPNTQELCVSLCLRRKSLRYKGHRPCRDYVRATF